MRPSQPGVSRRQRPSGGDADVILLARAQAGGQPYSGSSGGCVPSTGNPSFCQYSMPPINSFTLSPSALSRAAALVEPLQPGPQQWVTITLSLGSTAAVSALIERLGRLIAPGMCRRANASADRTSTTTKPSAPRSMSKWTSAGSVSNASFDKKCWRAIGASAAAVSVTSENCAFVVAIAQASRGFVIVNVGVPQ